MDLKLKDMSAKCIGQNVSVEGTVIKTETQYPFLQTAAFQCLRCCHMHYVRQDGFKLREPLGGCENETCGKKVLFKLVQEESTYIDAQEIEIFDYSDDGYKYERELRRVQLKVILLGDTVGKTKLENKYKFTGKFTTSELGRKLEYLLHADTVEKTLTEEELKILAEQTKDAQRNKIQVMKAIMKGLSEKYPSGKIPLEEIYTESKKQGIDRIQAEENIKKMKQRGDMLSPDQKHIRLVK